MFKKIPQDQIVRRTFQVNKDVKLTQDDVDVYQVYGVTMEYDMILHLSLGYLIVFLVIR